MRLEAAKPCEFVDVSRQNLARFYGNAINLSITHTKKMQIVYNLKSGSLAPTRKTGRLPPIQVWNGAIGICALHKAFLSCTVGAIRGGAITMNMRAIKANGGSEALSDGGFMLPPGRALDICQQLQSAILEHKLSPGAKLSEDEVGEIFGVSRTVVRTALQALAHTGLVSVERNRGAFVARPSTREAHEVFEARALIEPRLARAAAKAATLADLAELEAHLVAEHEAMAAGNKGRALALSGAFHLVISRMAGQQVLDTFLQSLISRSSLVIALYWRRPDTTCEHHSHEALVKALAAHHGDDAEAIMKSHIIDLHSGLDLADRPKAETRLSEIFKS